ncbi:MAG: methylated-DNA--[protein]-cysteine S-methyltransferase [Pseudomonadota bacterium]
MWLTVCAIPKGRVATYGDIAARAGLPGSARRVGAALRKLPKGTEVPWHRVVNASGKSSLPSGSGGAERQYRLLESEGVYLKIKGLQSFRKYRW